MKYLLIVLPFLAACGSGVYKSDEPPTRPYGEFGRVEIRELTVQISNLETLSPELQTEIAAAARTFPGLLEARLNKKHLFEKGSKRTLVIQGSLLSYDPGSRTTRWLLGFGAGTGYLTTSLRFTDDAGAQAGAGKAIGTVSGGFTGGSMDSAANRMADAIVRYLQENGKEVVKP